MIEAVLALSIAGHAFTVWRFLAYIRYRDGQEQILWNRIQAPETAVVQTIDAKPGSVSYVGEVPDNVSTNGTET